VFGPSFSRMGMWRVRPALGWGRKKASWLVLEISVWGKGRTDGLLYVAVEKIISAPSRDPRPLIESKSTEKGYC
jgi:hypothetical protein